MEIEIFVQKVKSAGGELTIDEADYDVALAAEGRGEITIDMPGAPFHSDWVAYSRPSWRLPTALTEGLKPLRRLFRRH